MAGCDKEAGQTYVDTSALDLLTNDLITSEGYFAEGHYKSEKAMEDSNELTGTGTTNWWFKQVAGIKVNSSSTQSLLNATYGEAFDKISELTLSATLTIWGEYNNKYVPGNYLDLVVMTPDGHKHYGSGKYFIISSDDSITSDGYTTTLKLLKNTDISKNTFADNFTAEKVKPGTYAHDINPYTETGTQYSGKNGTPTTEEILASYKTRVDKIVGEDFQLTAYCGCSVCCGSNADGYTATGTKATQGRTIAVDPNVIPLHSEVTIKLKTSDGKYQTLGNYIAEDTGSAIKEHIIDVYFDNHQEALNFGRKYNAIVIVTSYK
ncbi:MAG: 3D domain-containing protein [Bacilli bacterium]|nr:3D domain-containing protein [Bacilli bacterium]MBQ3307536.1 3D domain-containing protein [Bacilli bacterium]